MAKTMCFATFYKVLPTDGQKNGPTDTRSLYAGFQNNDFFYYRLPMYLYQYYYKAQKALSHVSLYFYI